MLTRGAVFGLCLLVGACGGAPDLTGAAARAALGDPVAGAGPSPDTPPEPARAPTWSPDLRLDPRPAPPQLQAAGAASKIQASARPSLTLPALPEAPPPAPPTQLGPWRRTGPDPTRCDLPVAPGRDDVTYVCDCQAGASARCVAGSDSNPGTSQAPLQSFSAAMAALQGLTAGGSVALCRGGRWLSGPQRINANTGCSAASPCVLTDYDPQWTTQPEPSPVVELNEVGAHYLIGIEAGNASHVNEGLEFTNLTLTSQLLDGKAIFVYRTVNDVRMSCLDISGFAVGVQLATNGARIVVQDSRIHDNGEQGYLGGCNDCGVERSSFVNNGFVMANAGRGQFSHNLYMSPASVNPQEADGMFVRDSYFTESSVNASSGQCMGVSLTVHGGLVTNLEITGNLVEEAWGAGSPGCWGITVDATNFDAERNENVRIANNVVRNVGNVGIGLSSCVHCAVENNVIIQQFDGGTRAIMMPDRPRQPEDAISSDVVLRNNTIYFGHWGTGVGIQAAGEGTGYVVSNNIVAHAGTAGLCLRMDSPAASYAAVGSNLCAGGVLSAEAVTRDAHLEVADPQFVDAPADLRLQAGSVALDSGASTQASAADHFGSVRGDRPDRGAFERL